MKPSKIWIQPYTYIQLYAINKGWKHTIIYNYDIIYIYAQAYNQRTLVSKDCMFVWCLQWCWAILPFLKGGAPYFAKQFLYA